MKILKKSMRSLIPILIGIINLFILFYPNEILKASKDGIVIWATNVLPTLLPFIICTNILISTGAIEFMGTLLEPLIYPLFKLPGCSAFAILCGMISGYPIGAKVTCSLCSEQKISKSQAQRLISFCNNSGPLFILGTVGTAMLKNKNYGYFIMISHYLSAIIMGLSIRFFASKKKSDKILFYTLRRKQILNNNKTVGKIFADSVHDSIETVLQIGGFIVLFSIISKILELSNIIVFMWHAFSNFDFIKNMGYENFHGLTIGLVEVTNGAKILTAQNFSPKILSILSFLISFGGLCVHMQSVSFISKTDIKISLYLLAKLFQALISFFITKIFLSFLNLSVPASAILTENKYSFLSQLILSFKNFFAVIILNTVLIFALWLFRYLKSKKQKRVSL